MTTSFYIFFESFPSNGPVKKFNKLLIAGLARNLYMIVGRKRDIVDWYKRSFDGKKDIYNYTQSPNAQTTSITLLFSLSLLSRC